LLIGSCSQLRQLYFRHSVALQGTLFAVKRMNMANQPNEIDNLLAEIQLMRGLSHPHIVEYLGAWVDTVEGRHRCMFLSAVSICTCIV
jgi:serine/threonine protein kinase